MQENVKTDKDFMTIWNHMLIMCVISIFLKLIIKKMSKSSFFCLQFEL